MAKQVYFFGGGKADGKGTMKTLLGGKGANLAEMTRIGLPVPPGFTITTEVCTHYSEHRNQYPVGLKTNVAKAVARLEKLMGKKFGDVANPLLVSVRSGARESMPGMMDTILNLGLNDVTTEGLAVKTGNPRFAWDCYRRFLQMYGDVVMGVQKRVGELHDPFEEVLGALKKERGAKQDLDLNVDALKALVERYKKLIKERTGRSFPEKPLDQLWGAITAVFSSWDNDRAVVYRRKYSIPHDWGTAVNVQTMVYGNMGDTSATGVAFTRNPANGVNEFYGEYLINAQGEDVVAGVRTPKPIAQLKKDMPAVFKELVGVCHTLEHHFHDVQDFEFTVEDKHLFMLQTRNGKRTGLAAFKFACDMVTERLITSDEAVMRVPAEQVDQVLAPIFDEKDLAKARKNGRRMAVGLAAGPGAASGRACFDADEAAEMAKDGKPVILVRIETSPEDLRGMIAAEGILTAKGGVSSHAALVARQMGKVCVCGCGALEIDYVAKTLTAGGHTVKQGEYLSIDGTAGEVYQGQIKTAPSEIIQVLVDKTLDPKKSDTYQDFARLMKWADKHRRLDVRTNADQPDQAANAVAFGAVGIGLCRTEHMFFEGDRIYAVRKMILAEDEKDRRAALAKLLPYQRKDFAGIFEAMAGRPVTIRLLDPPLHEFLPHDDEAVAETARKIGVSEEAIRQRVGSLHESNPMLGHRGCRLGNVYPEITEMQVRAIFEAAAAVMKKRIRVKPEIMVPLVGFAKELTLQLDVVKRVAAEVKKETGKSVNYMVGTMIELPRAALVADQIADQAEFFSFGTNDLTQTTLGISRDDAGTFLPAYEEMDIVAGNPFATIDRAGVGSLMKQAIALSRSVRPGIKLGICGEHGGDPSSVEFCHQIGLNYVSCSPFRVPTARLAAAQAALTEAASKPPKKKSAPKKKKAVAKKKTRKKTAKKVAAKKTTRKKAVKKAATKKKTAKKKTVKKAATKKRRRA